MSNLPGVRMRSKKPGASIWAAARAANSASCSASGCDPATTRHQRCSGPSDGALPTASTNARTSFPRRLVARHEFRRTPHRDREHPRRLPLVGAGCTHPEVVDRVLRRLLERDAHDASAIAEFYGSIADQQTSEVLDRHLALKGHAAAARRVGAHSRSYRPSSGTPAASRRTAHHLAAKRDTTAAATREVHVPLLLQSAEMIACGPCGGPPELATEIAIARRRLARLNALADGIQHATLDFRQCLHGHSIQPLI